jgi:hypothetical protein
MFVQRIPKDLEILITRKSDKFVDFLFNKNRKKKEISQRSSTKCNSIIIGFIIQSNNKN